MLDNIMLIFWTFFETSWSPVLRQ